MILLDANVLLYAYISYFPQHTASKAWLEAQISAGEKIGLSWQVIIAFARIGTNPRIFTAPMTIDKIEKIIGTLLLLPNVEIVLPTANHWQIFLRLLKDTNASGNLVSDAHLAALTIEYSATLATTDKDFAKFNGLNYSNPLTI